MRLFLPKREVVRPMGGLRAQRVPWAWWLRQRQRKRRTGGPEAPVPPDPPVFDAIGYNTETGDIIWQAFAPPSYPPLGVSFALWGNPNGEIEELQNPILPGVTSATFENQPDAVTLYIVCTYDDASTLESTHVTGPPEP